MNTSPKILGRFTISPQYQPRQLLAHIGSYSGEAFDALSARAGDDYDIEPRLRGLGKFENFLAAYQEKKVSKTERLLTLRELLILHIRSRPALRLRSPFIICEGFALDFTSVGEENGEDSEDFDSAIHSFKEIGDVVLSPDTRFAMTRMTLLEKGVWSERMFDMVLAKPYPFPLETKPGI